MLSCKTCKFLAKNTRRKIQQKSPCKFLPGTCKFLQDKRSQEEKLSCKGEPCKSNG